jgi:hypothetical protein
MIAPLRAGHASGSKVLDVTVRDRAHATRDLAGGKLTSALCNSFDIF